MVPRACSNEFVPAFPPLDWSAVNNNLEMIPRGEIFNAGLKAKYFGLGCCLNHLDSTRENNSRIYYNSNLADFLSIFKFNEKMKFN